MASFGDNRGNVPKDSDELSERYVPLESSNSDNIALTPLCRKPSSMPRPNYDEMLHWQHQEEDKEYEENENAPHLNIVTSTLRQMGDMSYTNSAKDAYVPKGSLSTEIYVPNSKQYAFNPDCKEFIPSSEYGVLNTKFGNGPQHHYVGDADVQLFSAVSSLTMEEQCPSFKQKLLKLYKKREKNVAISSIMLNNNNVSNRCIDFENRISSLETKANKNNVDTHVAGDCSIGSMDVCLHAETTNSVDSCLRIDCKFRQEPAEANLKRDAASVDMSKICDLNHPIVVKDILPTQKVWSWLNSESLYKEESGPSMAEVVDEKLTFQDMFNFDEQKLAFRVKSQSHDSASPRAPLPMPLCRLPVVFLGTSPSPAAMDLYNTYRKKLERKSEVCSPATPVVLSVESQGPLTLWDLVEERLQSPGKQGE